jgi:hypothetical protein
VRIYTSWRRTPMPTVDPDGVRGMSVPNPEAFLAYAKGLVDDMFARYPLDWYGDGDLVRAMKAVEGGHGGRPSGTRRRGGQGFGLDVGLQRVEGTAAPRRSRWLQVLWSARQKGNPNR